MRLLVVTFACIILAATEAGASVYKGKVKDAKTGEELIGADGMPYFRIRMRYPAQTADKKPAKYLDRVVNS